MGTIKAEFKSRGVRATIWENDRETREGNRFKSYSVEVYKSWYDDKAGEWKKTTHFDEAEMPYLVKCTGKAFDWLVFRKEEEARK